MSVSQQFPQEVGHLAPLPLLFTLPHGRYFNYTSLIAILWIFPALCHVCIYACAISSFFSLICPLLLQWGSLWNLRINKNDCRNHPLPPASSLQFLDPAPSIPFVKLQSDILLHLFSLTPQRVPQCWAVIFLHCIS